MVLWVGRGFANFVLAQIPQDCHPAHSPFIWLYMTWRNMRWIIVKIKIIFVMKCACVCVWYMYLCEWGCLLNTWCEIYYLFLRASENRKVNEWQYLRLSPVFCECIPLFLKVYWVWMCRDILWRCLERFHYHRQKGLVWICFYW